MVSLIRSRSRLVLAFTVSLLLLVVLVAGGWMLDLLPGSPSSPSRDSLRDLRARQRQFPGDASLLLQSARHHYRAVRHRLQSGTAPLRTVYPLLKHALRQYRQLQAQEDWELSRVDSFNQAYLYYTLGRFYSNRAPTMASKYFARARDLGLTAHEKGHRSPELVALLANVHYQVATREEDYRTALNYYSTLPEPIRDPVLLMNKALTLGALGQYRRAHSVLDRLAGYSMPGKTRTHLRVTRARLDFQQGRYRNALDRIDSIPRHRRSLEARTLRARCLMGLGKPQKARLELKEILRREEAPYQAEILFNNLRQDANEIRS